MINNILKLKKEKNLMMKPFYKFNYKDIMKIKNLKELKKVKLNYQVFQKINFQITYNKKNKFIKRKTNKNKFNKIKINRTIDNYKIQIRYNKMHQTKCSK